MKECCQVEKSKVEIPEAIRHEVEGKGGFEEIQILIHNSDPHRLTEIMKILVDEKRLTILYALAHQRMCVCMLAELTKCPYSKCSYHISRLKDIGFIKAKHLGNYIIYSLTPSGKKILKHLEKIKEVRNEG